MRDAKVELQDVFVLFADRIKEELKLSRVQWKAFNAISSCRTASLGGHSTKCPHCGKEHISYNSCRNRNCPKCGGVSKYVWLQHRLETVLDVQHLHLVFTTPHLLNAIAITNGRVFYDALFKAVKDTILEVCERRGFIPGFSAVLHTWGQNLSLHPHIHVPITSGGISLDETKWIDAKRNKDGTFYLAPIKVLSSVFRGKFVSSLRAAFSAGILEFDKKELSRLLNKAMSLDWVVYAKEPFKGAKMVYKYLGRYTHRTAITNERILSIDLENETVTFAYRDYADCRKEKTMTLDSLEFVRRFFLHILPSRFTRIRHYGFYSSAAGKKRRKAALFTHTKLKERKKYSTVECLLALYGLDITKCSFCGSTLVTFLIPKARSSIP